MSAQYHVRTHMPTGFKIKQTDDLKWLAEGLPGFHVFRNERGEVRLDRYPIWMEIGNDFSVYCPDKPDQRNTCQEDLDLLARIKGIAEANGLLL